MPGTAVWSELVNGPSSKLRSSSLREDGRPDLVDRMLHVAEFERDGAGVTSNLSRLNARKSSSNRKSRGGAQTSIYVSPHELGIAADHPDKYHLYRIFEFDEATAVGKVFIEGRADLSPILFVGCR